MNSLKALLIMPILILSTAHAIAGANPGEPTNIPSEGSMANNSYLTTDELVSLFSGSTMTGVFQGKPFGQRNHASGIAVLAIQGDEVRHLPWFTEAGGVYCEDWGRDGVLRFKLRRTDQADHYIVESAGSENTLKIVRELTHEDVSRQFVDER